MRIRLWKRKLKYKMLALFTAAAVSMLCLLGLFIYQSTNNTLRQEAQTYNTALVQQLTSNLDVYFNNVSSILHTIAGNSETPTALESYHDSYQRQLESNRFFHALLLSYSQVNPFLEDLIVIRDGRAVYNIASHSNDRFHDFLADPWFRATSLSAGKVAFIGPHEHSYYINPLPSQEVLSALIPIYSPFQTRQDPQGYLLADISLTEIQSLVNRTGETARGDLYILNDKNEVLLQSLSQHEWTDPAKLNLPVPAENSGTLFADVRGENSLVIYHTSSVTGWKTVIVIPATTIFESTDKIRWATALVVSISVIVMIIISYVLANTITKPLSRLTTTMEQVGRGNYDQEVAVTSQDEIGLLTKEYNKMLRKLNQLVNENYLAAIESKEARYQALRAKFNPHFFNNVLQTIRGLAVMERHSEIEELIEKLGEMFAYVLYEDEQWVTLEKEVNYLSLYLSSYQWKGSRNFSFRTDVDDDAKRILVPKLLLQPLVENALKHGGRSDGTPIVIGISAAMEDRFVKIEIRDNGNGIDKSRLDMLNRHLRGEPASLDRVGISHVRERLKLAFDHEAKLELNSAEGEGTTAVVILPPITNRKGMRSDETVAIG